MHALSHVSDTLVQCRWRPVSRHEGLTARAHWLEGSFTLRYLKGGFPRMTLELLLLAFGKAFLFVLAAILPIVNPAATAPIFLSLTEGASTSTRTALARKISRYMMALMIGSMLVGSIVLDFFGISLPIVRVGGGLIVAANAWRLLNANHALMDTRTELAESFTIEQASRQAFYPLTFPIACGPGSIAAAITVGASLHDVKIPVLMAHMSGGAMALVSIGGALYFVFRYAARLLRPLGEAGVLVFLRLSAFILLCLGVQIVWDGASELLIELLQVPLQP
jgi:multiple antibiotic resistance protein